jgi:glycosyltransferase involved in cell wall biosynthesis
MRVVIDLLGSTEKSGGMRLHATQIVQRWSQDFPSDELHVVGPEWARCELESYNVTVHKQSNESIIVRCPGQLVRTATVARRVDADAVLSLSPIVTPFGGDRPRACFQHDWRHLKNRAEFGAAQQLYRRLWASSAKWSDITFCISGKARDETRRIVPSAQVKVVTNGYDHARRWPALSTAARSWSQVVTFGHHNNKRPELAIRAFGYLGQSLPKDSRLVVLGARGAYAEELRSLALDCGVSHRTVLPGFVSERQYQELVSSSGVIALLSSDEGFGLPISEALALGIPAIITTDSGMDRIFGAYPVAVEPKAESVATALSEIWKSPQCFTDRKAIGMQTWSNTVAQVREALRELCHE